MTVERCLFLIKTLPYANIGWNVIAVSSNVNRQCPGFMV